MKKKHLKRYSHRLVCVKVIECVSIFCCQWVAGLSGVSGPTWSIHLQCCRWSKTSCLHGTEVDHTERSDDTLQLLEGINLWVLHWLGPRGAWGHCRISPPRFLAESCKRRLNQGSFVSAVCLVVCFLWFVLCLCVYFCDLYWVFSLLFVCQ